MTIITKFAPTSKVRSPKNLKGIQITHLLSEYNGGFLEAYNSPRYIRPEQWDNIMLISLGHDPEMENNLDTFMAWSNNSPDNIYIYLGHWNDGVIAE